jgi:type IV secretion system protein VirD4
MFPSVPIPTMPPWYTLFALSLLGLAILGLYLALAKVVFGLWGRALGLPWYALTTLVERVFRVPLTSHGTARFSTLRELTQKGIIAETPSGIALAQTTSGEMIQAVSGGHIAVFGPPRSGKSRRILMPLIRQSPHSLVMADLRDELYRETHTAREALGPTFRFSPGAEESCALNPLDLVRWGTRRARLDVHRQMHQLVRPEPGGLWDGTATVILTAIALYCHRAGEGSFPAMVRWMQDPDVTLKAKIETLRTDPNRHVAAAGGRLANLSERMRQGVWGRALEALDVFQDELVAQHTTHSDVDLRQLQHGLEPVSVYLNIDFGDIKQFGPLIGLLVDSLVAICGGPQPTPPQHRVLMVLDELANLGRLEELETSVSHLQGSGVQIVAAFQNLPQVYQTFDEDTPLLASFGTQVHYRPQDLLTASYISQQLGMGTVWAPQASVSRSSTWSLNGSSWGQSTSQGVSATGRDLLTVDEVLRLPDDAALVFLDGLHPTYGRKLGLPPVGTVVQLADWARTHRQEVAGLAAAALLLLALHPLWWQSARTAQPAPLLASLTTPTPSDTEAITGVQPAQWRLWTTHDRGDGKVLPWPMGHFATKDECIVGLSESMKMPKHPANLKSGMVKMVRDEPDSAEWIQGGGGAFKGTTIKRWCAEQ